MKKTILFASLLLLAVASGFAGNTAAWYRRGSEQYEKRLKLTLQNPLAEARTEEPVVLRLDEIRKQAPDFSAGSFSLVDPAAVPESPCHLEEGGNDVPCEAEDADGDGTLDELVFLATLPANESRTYWLYYTPKNGPTPPVYPKRTQITNFKSPFSTIDPNALFAIESDVLMYRFGRGDAPGLGLVGDVFGKYKERPAYLQHLFFRDLIWALDADTPAGRWLLHPLNKPDQLGLGGLVALKGGQVFRPDASAKIEGKILLNGRLRSQGKITIVDWKVGNAVLDVRLVVTMYAGQPYAEYELEAKASGSSDGLQLAVGMMKLTNQEVVGGLEEGSATAWGVRDVEFSPHSKTAWYGYGYPEAKKWDAKTHGKLEIGLGLMFKPGEVAELKKDEAGTLLVLKGAPSENQPLKARLGLSGGWKRGGYIQNAQEFFTYHQRLSRKMQAPIRVAISTQEVRAPQRDRPMFPSTVFFLSNPSSQANALPAEVDLDAFGLEATKWVVCSGKDSPADIVKIGEHAKVFIRAPVAALKTISVTLTPGKASSSPSFKITEEKSESGGLKAVRVEAGEMAWLVSTNGLARATWKGKDLELQQPGLGGDVQVVHNGSVVAVVRVGSGESAVDYCFFRGLPAVKIFSGREIDLRGGKGCSSYVAKKEIRCEGAETLPICSWGRVSSEETAFKKMTPTGGVKSERTDVCFPAEWMAIMSLQQQAGLMVYGNPSTGPILVEKGGVFHVDKPAPGERRVLTLCLLERPEEGEEIFPRLCQPIVSVKRDGGFVSHAYRDGNGTPDAVFAEDRNGNGEPDFVGDRWSFDMNSDDALESILEFEPAPGKTERAAKMKVHCDTTTGQTELHSNQLLGRFDTDRPFFEIPYSGWNLIITNVHYYDGCLGPYETKTPFFTYEDWDGDGLFFKGPVTEGGFISGDRVETRYEGVNWMPGVFLKKDWVLECWDLDGDRDNDVWWFNTLNSPEGVHHFFKGDKVLTWGYFDLSDVNLEPIAMVDAFRGRAGWAIRFGSFLDSDNGKLYQFGFEKDGRRVGFCDWPFASGWDIDNDGVAEGTVYNSIALYMLALDLLNPINADDPYVGQRLYLEKDSLYTHPTRHENFCLFLRACRDQMPADEFNLAQFPDIRLKDPAGHVMRFSGLGVPDGWKGERLQCREWPNGLYDYTEKTGWHDFLKDSYYVACLHWLRSPTGSDFPFNWRTAHEANWGGLYCHGDTRLEVNPEGGRAHEYSVWFSPIVNDYHLKNIQFGVQTMGTKQSSEDRIRYEKPYHEKGQAVQEYACPEVGLNDYSRLARKNGMLFLYYSDDDGDGYVDSYLLDNEHDGVFEKRAWLDRKNKTLSVFDRGRLAVVPFRLEMPEFRFELKNYAPMVDLYRATAKKEPLLWKWTVGDGRLEPHDGSAFVLANDWLPKVAADIFHLKNPADPWKDYEPAGLDTLARIINQQVAETVVLKEAWSAQSLAGVDVLVVRNLDTTPSDAEQAALDAFLKGDGTLLLLAGPGMPEASVKVMADLAARHEFSLSKEPAVAVTPSMKREQLEGFFKEAKAEESVRLLNGVLHPCFLESGTLQAGERGKVLLKYAGQTALAEAAVGNGRVVVVPSNLFDNKFMCLEHNLRKHSFKPGNQQVAWNLVRHLLESRRMVAAVTRATANSLTMEISGKGGTVSCEISWADATIRVNGKEQPFERKEKLISVKLPPGRSILEVSSK